MGVTGQVREGSVQFSSVQFSRSVVSNSWWPHESQHARLPCPSPTLGVHSNSCPSSPWCRPAILSSVVPFSSCPQSLPASESFPMSQLFSIGGQSIGVFSFSISPSNEHPGLISFRMDWLDLFAVQGTLKSLLQHHSSKASILRCSAFFTVQISHPYMTTGKTIALTRWTFAGKVISLLFNMLSRLVITFSPITSWQIDGETVEQWLILFFWVPKSLQMVIAAMKLKDAYSLEGKLWPT